MSLSIPTHLTEKPQVQPPFAQMREAWMPLLQAAAQSEDLDLWRIAIEVLEAWYAEQCLVPLSLETQHPDGDSNAAEEDHLLTLADATRDSQQACQYWQSIARTLESLLVSEHPDPYTPDGTCVSLAVLYETSKLEAARCHTQAQHLQAALVLRIGQQARLFSIEPLRRW